MSPEENDAEQNDTAPTDSGQQKGAVDPAEETKRKFREALEAKKNGRRGEDHLADGPQHAHGHGPVDAKRTFRRKTG